MKKIRLKLLLRFILIALIPTTCLSAFTNLYSTSKMEHVQTNRLKTEMRFVADSLGRELGQSEIKDLVSKWKETSDYDIVIYQDNQVQETTMKDNDTVSDFCHNSKEVTQVCQNGKIKFLLDCAIGKGKWNICIAPAFSSDRTVNGVVVVGQKASKLQKLTTGFTMKLIYISNVLLAITGIYSFLAGKRIVRQIKGIEKHLAKMSKGDLSDDLSEKFLSRPDELGDIAKELDFVQREWRKTISEILKRSKELAEASNQLKIDSADNAHITNDFAKAVEEIAAGSMSNVEETQNAAKRMGEANIAINSATDVLDELVRNANTMREAGTKATATIEELSESNDSMLESIEKISNQTDITNQAVNRISEAISIIDMIASETSLLALNASIEAARAGDEGRGFAVVAGEIQKLAEQTNQSVGEIGETITELLSDSKEMVNVMEEVNQNVATQAEKFLITKEKFSEVGTGITVSVDGIKNMRKQFKVLTEAKDSVLEGLSSLLRNSEDSAASTEEATASSEELAAKTDEITNSTKELDDISKNLYNSVDTFIIK